MGHTKVLVAVSRSQTQINNIFCVVWWTASNAIRVITSSAAPKLMSKGDLYKSHNVLYSRPLKDFLVLFPVIARRIYWKLLSKDEVEVP